MHRFFKLYLGAVALFTAGAANAEVIPYPGVVTLEVTQTASGKAWSGSSGNLSVNSGKVLDVILANNLVCDGVVSLRRYSNYSTSNVSFTTYNNPSTPTGLTAANVGTRQSGTAAQGGMQFFAVVRDPGSMTGTPGVTDGILANSKEEVDLPYSIPPGKNFGIEISGLTGALSAAVVVSVTIAGFCR